MTVDCARQRGVNFACPHLVSHSQSMWNKVKPKIYLSRVDPAGGGRGAEKHQNVAERLRDEDEKRKKLKGKRKCHQSRLQRKRVSSLNLTALRL